MSNFNKFKSTTVYGDFNNKDLDGNNLCNATYDRDVLIKGTLQSNDCSFNTVRINNGLICSSGVFDNITLYNGLTVSNPQTSVIISPTELSYLDGIVSPIQNQINNIVTYYDTSAQVNTKLTEYLKIVDASSNYLKITDASNNYLNLLDASNSYLKIADAANDYLTKSDASAGYLSKTDASNNYLTQGNAESIYLSKIDANDDYLRQGNADIIYLTKTDASTDYLKIIDASNNYFKLSDASDNFLKILDASNNYLKIIDASNNYFKLSDASNNFLKISDASNNYLKILDASNNYVKNTTLNTTLASYVTTTNLTTNYFNKTDISNNYLQKTSLLPTLLTSTVQVSTLDVMSNSLITLYNAGSSYGTISTNITGSYLDINAFGTLTYGIRLIGYAVVLASGFRGREGTDGSNLSTNRLNLWWTGSNLQLWVETSNIGNFTICDYRIKENFQPVSNVLDRLCSINMFNYETKDISIFKKKGTQIGFYAHELKDAFPELDNIVEGEKDALTEDGEIQPQTINAELVHLLMRSIQELNEKVEKLSNRIIELEKNK